ncbi:MAG: class I adenylate cyclase [Gammaproteobacteria bacterium]|nr:class I adenylate cyclase [Gammaproteobacteria bacterium]
MDVVDARDSFLSWNNHQLGQLIEDYDLSQQSALSLVPFLLQVNHRLLPGYHSPDTLHGIYNYTPDRSVIVEAKKINNRFTYNDKAILTNPPIDSVFVQRPVFGNEIIIWVVGSPTLAYEHKKDIENKLSRIITWLKTRELKVQGHMISADQLADAALFQKLKSGFSSASLFLDGFYAESFLMAGKYPVWWLVPPEKEINYDEFVTHLNQARYVSVDEYINLGCTGDVAQSEILDQSVSIAFSAHKDPESTWLKLLLLEKKQRQLPEVDGIAWRLKNIIYAAGKNVRETSPVSLYKILLQESMDDLSVAIYDHPIPLNKLVIFLWQNIESKSKQLLMAVSGDHDRQLQTSNITDVVMYLNLHKALFSEIRLVYEIILDHFEQHADKDQSISQLAKNIQLFLSDSDNKVSIVNTRNNASIIQHRIVIRHNVSRDQWMLNIELGEEEERKVSTFNSLLSLISWAWLNRIVDLSSQVSVDCPLRLVKQIEARYALEILIQRVDPDVISNISRQALEYPVHPVYSLLFFNLLITEDFRQRVADMTDQDDPLNFGHSSENLLTNCEQLIVDSWGGVEVRQYSGNDGVLQCLCDWTGHAPLSDMKVPMPLQPYGYASGESTYLAQRVELLYDELIQYFYQKKQHQGRFIVRISDEYYFVQAEDDSLVPQKLGSEPELLGYLGQPNEEFRSFALDRYSMLETPLHFIAEFNKPGVIQVFFRVTNVYVETYVMDEKGSLWSHKQLWFGKESYITHWFLLIRNIRNRLKKINYQDKELPTLEINQITNNQLGAFEFYPVGAESLDGSSDFINMKVSVNSQSEGEQINISCDGVKFNSSDYADRVLDECAAFLKTKMANEGRRFIFVTDIDVPLKFYGVDSRDDIQVSHFLRYKGNIEKRLAKLLGNPVF